MSFNAQPHFLSYSYRPHDSKFAFAFTILTRMKDRFDINYYNSKEIDIISTNPGTEIYKVAYNYFMDYSDSWFGLACSYDVSERFKIGTSLFLSAAYLSYRTSTSTIAYSATDTLWIDGVPNHHLF